jgi:fumarate reductase subunit C
MSVKPYVRDISKSTWYLGKRRDILHMIDETSSLFIGVYALLLLMGLRALAGGEAAYLLYLERLGSPLVIGFHWLVILFTLMNSISWFRSTPKAMRIQIGEQIVPGSLIAAGHYVAWVAVSLLIFFIAGVFTGG